MTPETAVERVMREGVLPLTKAARESGLQHAPCLRTLMRASISGRLEAVKVAGRWLTSAKAIVRWVEASQQYAEPPRAAVPRSVRVDTDAVLRRYGLRPNQPMLPRVPGKGRPPNTFVYVIEAIGEDRCKIGFSRRPGERLRELSTGSSARLRIAATFAGKRRDERTLHAEFSDLRLNGEWFAGKDRIRAALVGRGVPWLAEEQSEQTAAAGGTA